MKYSVFSRSSLAVASASRFTASAFTAATLLFALPSAFAQDNRSIAAVSPKAAANNAAESKTKALTPLSLDDLFPKKSYFGRAARGVSWSHDDRFIAYLWNPYDEKGGSDLYVYDTKNGKTRRLTSIATFLPFDRELPEIQKRYEKDKIEDARRKTLSKEERTKLEDEDAKKEAERKTPLKEYSGVGEIVWANKSHEMLFTYRGDIYRLTVTGDEKAIVAPTRLTRTRDVEADIRYSKDDSGFTFVRLGGIYRMRLNSPEIVQLNPELPNNMDLQGYRLSPDETQLVIFTSRRVGPPSREVPYIVYRDRFAQARTTQRDVGDDPVRTESYVFAYDLNDDPQTNPKHDGKPWEVYKRPEGEAGDISMHDKPFSPDGKQFVFAAWKRDKKELTVFVADVATKKTRTVYKDTADGEHRSPSLTQPFYSPDGKQIALLLEKSGYRHAYLLNPLNEGATQLTRGDFEVYPLAFTPDSKSLLVTSDKEDTARMDLYRVSLPDGNLTRLTEKTGVYSGFELSNDRKKATARFTGWNTLPELCLWDNGKEKTLTDSHSAEAKDKMTRLIPRRFVFQNRHGHTVNGYVTLPPGWKKEQKRPLLIYVYGGPLGTTKQVMEGSFGGDNLFNVYAAESLGYITAVIDPRGSSGYGAVFGKANYEAPGVAQVEDLTDGAKFLIQEYNVDPTKVGVRGWSFGGFQTQMCLYTASDVFTLGIAGAGPTEWQNYNNWYVGGVIGANKKAEELDKYSLTKLAKNLKSPLLLLHGLEDTNVLAQDTIKVYRELLKSGKGPLVELVLDPTGGHGLGGDIKTKDRFAIYAGFLERRWGVYKP
jgi:dipeptidyl-peptidase 4